MPTINATIVTGADDGNIATAGGSTVSSNYASTVLQFGVNAPANAFMALRFQSINIPAGSTITSAFLTLTKIALIGTFTGRIYGNDIDDAPVWGSGNRVRNISKTSAFTAFDTASAVPAHDVTAIIAEIVARGGWISGNDLAFGAFPITGAFGIWQGSAYEAGIGVWPLLDIIYTAPAAGNNQVLMS